MPQSYRRDKLMTHSICPVFAMERIRKMSRRLAGVLAVVCAAVLAGVPAQAREVAGVTLEEEARIDGVAAPLVLNGAGVRSKFFVKVYAAGLYLGEKATSAEAILASAGPKRVRMHFIYDEVSAEKLRAGWSDGYAANHSTEVLAGLKDRIEQFNSYFPTLKAGDVVDVDYVPGSGTSVRLNGEAKGTISGEDFHQATLRIWLGDSPASSGLKKAMVAGDG